MLVFLLWAFESVKPPPFSRRGESIEFCERLEGEVKVEEGSRAACCPALGIVVVEFEGFSVAFQTSISIGEKVVVTLSSKPSGD